MRRTILLLWLAFTFLAPDLKSQSKGEIKNYFYDAESWILFEDYKEALPLYLQLLKIYPTNSNFKYRVGQCYINTPGEKHKAITYLEDAVKNINPRYHEGKFRESGAPYDALYYLANAYRINNQLDKALETYELFRKNMNPEIYDSNVVALQIQSCINAKQLIGTPLYVRERNLGNLINESTSEFNPVITDNEDMIIYSKSEAFYDAILYSKKQDGKWSGPVNMNEVLKVDRDLFPTSVSKDGKDLYLYSSADYDGIIYTSRYEDGAWSPIVKLNDNINTKFWESHATISHDNKKLYFTSNRKGSYGGLDIYVSKRDSLGNWGPAENLGSVINTPYNEESPFLSEDDRTLFFSSRGHYNMGGYDVFYSTLLDDKTWSVPLNAGYPLNSTDDDVFFTPVNKGWEGYYSRENNDGFGKQDIYRIEIFSEDHPRKFIVRGMVRVADLNSNINDSVRIIAKNRGKDGKTYVVYSNPATGEYEFELPQGDYELTYDGEGGEKTLRNLNLALTEPADSFVLPGTILPKTDFVADFYLESNKTISVSSGDTIVFPMRVEPKSTVTVEHWAGDSLLSVRDFFVTDSVFTYKMVPVPGDNRLIFKLTDRFNNTTTTDVFITREKEIITQPIVRPEYTRVIARKQIAALTSVLKDRADDKLRKVISGANINKQKFGRVDDLISYLKDEAAKKSISPEEVDKLALTVAVRDNILTQAAVDMMAMHTTGELKQILENLDIYNENLKTWTDLQKYVMDKTQGRITPEELNRIAAEILAGNDPAVTEIRNKILTYAESSPDSVIIRESVRKADMQNLRIKSKWLKAFTDSLKEKGLSDNKIAALMAAISSLPDTSAADFLNELISHADEPLASVLKSINLKKEGIRTPADLIRFLLENRDKFPEDLVMKALADMIAGKNIPDDAIQSAAGKTDKVGSFKWVLAGLAALLLLILLFFRRKKKSDKK